MMNDYTIDEDIDYMDVSRNMSNNNLTTTVQAGIL